MPHIVYFALFGVGSDRTISIFINCYLMCVLFHVVLLLLPKEGYNCYVVGGMLTGITLHCMFFMVNIISYALSYEMITDMLDLLLVFIDTEYTGN